MRPSKIIYDPAKSVKQNAKKNGCSEDAIRRYIKKYNIDRRAEEKVRIITECREYWVKHPQALRSEVATKTGHGASTVSRYWIYITGQEEFLEFDTEKAKARNGYLDLPAVSDGNRKELMSEALAAIPDVVAAADRRDVSEFQSFLFEDPTKPMLFVSVGGGSGRFGALLYSLNQGIGVSVSTLHIAALPDATIRNARFLIMSKGGRNDDVVMAAKKVMSLNPEGSACYTLNPDPETNRMLAVARKNNARAFVFEDEIIKESNFIAIRPKFFHNAILYKAFTNLDNLCEVLPIDSTPESCFTYKLNKTGIDLPNLREIKHFVVLYSGYGEVAAHDFESMCIEGGLASVVLNDYRSYCHGRFIFAGNHTSNGINASVKTDTALVLLITPRESGLAKRVLDEAVPGKTPIVTITSDFNDVVSAIDLQYKLNVFGAYYAERCLGENPCSPSNFSSIDKRKPIHISFMEDLAQKGGLRLIDRDLQEAKALKQSIDAYLELEHANTAIIEGTKARLPIPTKKDIWEQGQYDADKYLCYAFRRKQDRHKGQLIPLGNMASGYPFKLVGQHFYTSESAYICGLFSCNTPEHIAIQQQLIDEKNGYAAKKVIRQGNQDLGRNDWEEFNVDWMLYCVWRKAMTNKTFQHLLLGIPEGAFLIEDTSFQNVRQNDTSGFWGARNPDIKGFSNDVKKYIELSCPDKSEAEKERILQTYTDDFCNYGTYAGCNAMGKILTIVKDCLHKGTIPDIDFDLLRMKNIHLLGKRLTFDRELRLLKQKTEEKECPILICSTFIRPTKII